MPRSSILPVLESLYIQFFESGIVVVQATDLTIGIIGKIEATVETPGSALFPAKKLIEITKLLDKEDDLIIDVSEGSAKLSCKKTRLKLRVTDTDDFPVISDLENANSFTIDTGLLLSGLNNTIYVSSDDNGRPSLNSVLLSYTANKKCFEVVATDGHRLSLVEEKTDFGNSDFSALLPKATAKIFLKALRNAPEKTIVSIDGKSCMFGVGSFIYKSKLIDQPFPDYRTVIPAGGDSQILPKSELHAALRRAMVVANEFTHDVCLHFDDENSCLNIEGVSSGDQNVLHESIPLDNTSVKADIGFNCKYLLDIISRIAGDSVEMVITGEASPAIFYGDNKQHLSIIMPMRI